MLRLKSFLLVCVFSLQIFAKVPERVIFETDMGNDIDDALALDMLYKYQDMGKAHILLLSSNKKNSYTIPFLDIMNNFYGYPDIPLATVKNSPVKEGKEKTYVEIVDDENLQYNYFKKSLNNSDTVADAVQKYRQILSSERDGSVVIISVGFLTNLSELLQSQPDNFSNLNGKELVKKKVKMVSVMGGDFRPGLKKGEFNIRFDIPSAKDFFQNWPTEIIVSTWEVGGNIIFPGTEVTTELNYVSHHPLKIAYQSYLPMPYDRPTWDLTSVLYALEPKNKYFSLSQRGVLSVDDKGFTTFISNTKGLHRFLIVNSSQSTAILQRFEELIRRKPSKYSE